MPGSTGFGSAVPPEVSTARACRLPTSQIAVPAGSGCGQASLTRPGDCVANELSIVRVASGSFAWRTSRQNSQAAFGTDVEPGPKLGSSFCSSSSAVGSRPPPVAKIDWIRIAEATMSLRVQGFGGNGSERSVDRPGRRSEAYSGGVLSTFGPVSVPM